MLKAGLSKQNITPPIGSLLAGYSPRTSEGIHDPLYSRALVLDDGRRKVVIIINDLLFIDKDLSLDVKKMIKEKINIPEDNIMIAATHTHSGPYLCPSLFPNKVNIKWLKLLKEKMLKATYMAFKRRKPCNLYLGKEKCYEVGKNRRNLKGPIDPDVTILYLEDIKKNCIGILVNYACHPTVLGPENKQITADFPYYMIAEIEKEMRAPVMFVNGAAGNINVWGPGFQELSAIGISIPSRNFNTAKYFGKILAKKALNAIKNLTLLPFYELRAETQIIELHLRELPSLIEATAFLKKIEGKLEELQKLNLNTLPTEIELMYAKHMIELILHVKNEKIMKTYLQALAVGNIALVGIPGELFVELGLELKKVSPFNETIIVGYANDYVGYIAPEKAYTQGGYETKPGWWCMLAPKNGEIILDATIKLLKKLKGF